MQIQLHTKKLLLGLLFLGINIAHAESPGGVSITLNDPDNLCHSQGVTINYDYYAKSTTGEKPLDGRDQIFNMVPGNETAIYLPTNYRYGYFSLNGLHHACDSRSYVQGGSCENNLAKDFYGNHVKGNNIKIKATVEKADFNNTPDAGYTLSCVVTIAPPV